MYASSRQSGLEIRFVSVDFAKTGRGVAKRLSPESEMWAEMSLIGRNYKRIMYIDYSPEALEVIKQYHPDIIPYPNGKVVEGYIEYIK